MKIFIISVFAIFNLFFLLLKEPLSGDGLFSASLTRLPWSSIWSYIVGDFHPPLYYLILSLSTKLFGYTDLVVKSLSVLFGFLSILLLFKLGKMIYEEETAFWSSLALAFLPLHIFVSRDVRMYPFFTFLTLLSFYLFFKVLEEKKFLYQLGLGGSLAMALYTHNWGILLWGYILISSILYKKIKLTVLPLALSLLIYLPWISFFWSQLIIKTNLGRNWGLPFVNFWPRLWGGILWNYNLLHLPAAYWWSSAIISCLAIIFLVVPRSSRRWSLILTLFLPLNLLLFYIMTYREPFLTFPHMAFLIPFYALGLGRGLSLIKGKFIRVGIFTLLALTLFTFNLSYHYYPESSGSRSAQLYIKSQLKEGNQVVVLTPYEALRMSWYSEITVDNFVVLSPPDLPSFVMKDDNLKRALVILERMKGKVNWVIYTGVDRYRKDKASIYDPQAKIKIWLKSNANLELPFGENTPYPVWIYRF